MAPSLRFPPRTPPPKQADLPGRLSYRMPRTERHQFDHLERVRPGDSSRSTPGRVWRRREPDNTGALSAYVSLCTKGEPRTRRSRPPLDSLLHGVARGRRSACAHPSSRTRTASTQTRTKPRFVWSIDEFEYLLGLVIAGHSATGLVQAWQTGQHQTSLGSSLDEAARLVGPADLHGTDHVRSVMHALGIAA